MSFVYGYTDTDKPTPVTKKTYTNSDKYAYQICEILLSPRMSEGLCTRLLRLIQQHHTHFLSLYGEKHFTAKFHYPRQILDIGPMVRTWTMRYEAKLNFFKQCSHIANFKNIAVSLANRHQRWMCYQLSSDHVLHMQPECGPVTSITQLKDESHDIQDRLCKIFQKRRTSPDITVSRTNWINCLGTTFKPNNAFVITGSDGLDPIFAKVMSIIVVASDFVIFEVNLCKTLYFDSHFSSFVIDYTSDRDLVALENLYDHYVYHSYTLSDQSVHITLRYIFL